MIHPVLDRWARGWRGPALAALVAFVAVLPGVLALPPLDRDEARFAQASAQMLESGDYVSINYQAEPRDKKPVGIYWLQALSVAGLSAPEARQIWAYRVPSLLAAMLAAAACAWGAAAFFGPGRGLMAGAILGASFILSTEGGIAKTDATLCACVTVMMACFARIYAASRGELQAGRAERLAFWAALAVGVLVKGPVAPMAALLTGGMLWAWDRKAPWARGMGWGWGLLIVAAVVGPWASAITVATDGGFWSSSIGGDLAPKITGGHQSHGAPPGVHLLLSPLLLFPAAMLLPAALVAGWRRRRETAVRFAVAWLVPTWLVFELLPTKLVHYTLPTYGALAWLAVAALDLPMGRVARWTGAALAVLAGVAFAAVVVYALGLYGDSADTVAAVLAAGAFLAAGLAGALTVLRFASARALAATLALGIVAHGLLTGAYAPALQPLWLSDRLAHALRSAGLDPRNGVTPGPVAVAGYNEPSLVFALGTTTQLGEGDAAAAAIADGRPAIVEARKEADFRAGLKARGAVATPTAVVAGIDYSGGGKDRLVIYRPSAAR